MRNLTIKREKSFVGSLAKMKIYIEDPVAGEITINDTPCRKIGDLKNGEEKVFQIDDGAAKVFVIADKLSKNYCNEYYQISAGQEDIFLSGKNKFNLAGGNPFQFDNNESEEVLANRKRTTRKGVLTLFVCVVVGLIIGYLSTAGLPSKQTPEAKKFSSNGMTITLTDAFKEADVENYTVAYDSRNVAVFALQEKFALVAGFEKYTLEQYADLVIQANKRDSSEAKTDNGLTWFEYEYTNPETNDTYRYYSYVYKTEDAFWMIQFATLTDNVERYAPQIAKWAESVTFAE